MSRKTEFWKSTTPDKLGPGTYQVSELHSIKPNKTAFLIKAKRQLSAPKPYNRFTPGPGAYDQLKAWQGPASQNSSGFASKTKRDLFNQSTKPSTPGPGSYDSRVASGLSKKRRPKPSALYLDPSPVSIPSNEVNPGQVDKAKPPEPEHKGTAFGKYKSVRNVFGPSLNNPGPGSYHVDRDVRGNKSWMFVSSTGRAESPANEAPGPGYYSVTPSANCKAGVFTAASKELPLTNNPYLPIQVGENETPPVGIYKLSEDLKKNEKLKAKYITGEIPTKHIPFNIQEKRQMPWLPKENFPGPGDYSVPRPKSTGSNFRSTRPRFDQGRCEERPGPGHSDLATLDKEKQLIVNKSPRFPKEDPRAPETYIGHSVWKAKVTRAADFEKLNPNLCFNSGQSRFKDGSLKETLGPGCYDKERPNTVGLAKVSNTERFEGFGSFRPGTGTGQKLGPGYYNPEDNQKKSFNFAKELNVEKIWL